MNYRYSRADRIDSVIRIQRNDNRLFNKVVADVFKQIKYRKKSVWCYLPSEEHLNSLLQRLNNEFELEIKYEEEYIMVRKK